MGGEQRVLAGGVVARHLVCIVDHFGINGRLFGSEYVGDKAELGHGVLLRKQIPAILRGRKLTVAIEIHGVFAGCLAALVAHFHAKRALLAHDQCVGSVVEADREVVLLEALELDVVYDGRLVDVVDDGMEAQYHKIVLVHSRHGNQHLAPSFLALQRGEVDGLNHGILVLHLGDDQLYAVVGTGIGIIGQRQIGVFLVLQTDFARREPALVAFALTGKAQASAVVVVAEIACGTPVLLCVKLPPPEIAVGRAALDKRFCEGQPCGLAGADVVGGGLCAQSGCALGCQIILHHTGDVLRMGVVVDIFGVLYAAVDFIFGKVVEGIGHLVGIHVAAVGSNGVHGLPCGRIGLAVVGELE